MSVRIVTTKEELRNAKQDKVEEIIVIGKLASDLKDAKKITTLSAVTLGVLTTAIGVGVAAIPFTGGISLGLSAVTALPIAASTGITVPAIILASSMGIGVIIALFKDYQEVEFDASKPSIRMRRK